MLTRTQVATRLGKSVATVRRLEGVLLHPERGWDGIWRFCPDEVDGLARDGYPAQLRGLSQGRPASRSRSEDERAGEQRRQHARAREADLNEQLERMREVAAFLARVFMDTASSRMVAALDEDLALAIQELLES